MITRFLSLITLLVALAGDVVAWAPKTAVEYWHAFASEQELLPVYPKGMHHYHLYSITSPSGMVYIGQTRRLEARTQTYRRLDCPKQHILLRSLRKYGWENHHLEILAEGEMTQEEINRLEIDAIAEAKAEGVSMNICAGGEIGPAYKWGDHPSARPVLQFDLQGNLIKEWSCASEAAETIPGIDQSGISIARRKQRFYAYGYLWCYKAEYDSGVRPTHDRVQRRNLRAVMQFRLDGELVATHRSAATAGRTTGFNATSIRNCLNRGQGTSGGYLWCYKHEHDAGHRPSPVLLTDTHGPRPVLMFGPDGTFLKEFDTVGAAEAESGLGRSQITRQCQGLIKRPVGVYFRYKPMST